MVNKDVYIVGYTQSRVNVIQLSIGLIPFCLVPLTNLTYNVRTTFIWVTGATKTHDSFLLYNVNILTLWRLFSCKTKNFSQNTRNFPLLCSFSVHFSRYKSQLFVNCSKNHNLNCFLYRLAIPYVSCDVCQSKPLHSAHLCRMTDYLIDYFHRSCVESSILIWCTWITLKGVHERIKLTS